MTVIIDEGELRRLLEDAYEKGWRGTLELKDATAEKLLEEAKKISKQGGPEPKYDCNYEYSYLKNSYNSYIGDIEWSST